MVGSHTTLILRRFGSAAVDWSIEFGGGLLGSYFGVMIAALMMASHDGSPAEEVQASMWHGLGFGFVFWAFSVSFINRVLIQGLSRASIGKKIFKLELISSSGPLTWKVMIKRWVLSQVSLAVGGLGYIYLIFDSEARAFHDLVAQTDVVPLFQSGVVSMEYREETKEEISRVFILPNPVGERPMATLIKIPLSQKTQSLVSQSLPVEKFSVNASTNTGAEVIQLAPQQKEKKAA